MPFGSLDGMERTVGRSGGARIAVTHQSRCVYSPRCSALRSGMKRGTCKPCKSPRDNSAYAVNIALQSRAEDATEAEVLFEIEFLGSYRAVDAELSQTRIDLTLAHVESREGRKRAAEVLAAMHIQVA